MPKNPIAFYLSFRPLLFLGSIATVLSVPVLSQAPHVLQVDASEILGVPPAADFHGGTSIDPAGHTVGMNSRYLLRDGRPWLPVMGEFHYTRVPEAQWEAEILKMKSAGVSIIATYVIWIHHEEVEGRFDWTGSRDLRRFVQLCAKHGMYVYPRIGPWAHGEVRNGGLPDWLLQKTQNIRSNDPVYLSYVNTFYAQVAAQLKGQLWKDGGPVIGIQLENEYARNGVNEGEAHIRELKRLAVGDGLDVPIYSVTGWDGAVVPHGEVVAVFGGYPEAPWGSSMTDLPPQEVYAFRFGSRVTGDMGAIRLGKSTSTAFEHYDFPFMTAEMGGGIQDTYHRRPIIQPNDIAAMVPVMLGSGVNLYGSYMFQGGENPDGKLTTLQESQRTNYPTDVPVKSYDFQAPLGEFGEERPVLRKLKVFNYFMQDFGQLLAPMASHAPSALPASPGDLSVARIAVRSDGKQGFLFFNNYVRGSQMAARPGFQVQVKLADGVVSVPDTPINLPSGAFGIWPINLDLRPHRLVYATAELFTRTTNGKDETYYFVETPGVAAEFVWKDTAGLQVIGSAEKHSIGCQLTAVDKVTPSLQPFMTADGQGGSTTRFVLLSQSMAENAWKIGAESDQHLVVTSAQFYADAHKATLESNGNSSFAFDLLPKTTVPLKGSAPLHEKVEQFAARYTSSVSSENPSLTFNQVAQAGQVPTTPIGPALSWRPHGVAMAPSDNDWTRAAVWKITLAAKAWQGVDELFLKIAYDGDIARLTSGGKLLVDNFYNEKTWSVGLSRFRKQINDGGLELRILPRRLDAPVFLEQASSKPEQTGQVMILRSLKLEPQYRLTLDVESAQNTSK